MKNNLTHGERFMLGLAITIVLSLAISIISLMPWFFVAIAIICAISYAVGYSVEMIDDYVSGKEFRK